MEHNDINEPGPEENPFGSDDQKKITDNARLLFGTLKNDHLPAGDKELIWNRILDYVHTDGDLTKQNSLRRIAWYQAVAAAALLLLFGLGYNRLKGNTEEAMRNAAKQASFTSADTKLILADERTIDLKGKNSDVVYQKEVIRIDSQIIARQIVPDNKSGLNTLVVPFGKRSTIILPDGSKVWVNSGSKLVYPSNFQDGKREVFLEGQAYFSVTHDTENPFYVQTKNMSITVLGTEFDVSSYDDDSHSYAVLAKGSIDLVTEKNGIFGAKTTRMVPGTRASYSGISNALQINTVNVKEYISWKDGYLILNKAPLTEILKKLSRYYQYELRVQSPEIGRETFSGTLDLQENIGSVMEAIATATSLSYNKTERRYILDKPVTQK